MVEGEGGGGGVGGGGVGGGQESRGHGGVETDSEHSAGRSGEA